MVPVNNDDDVEDPWNRVQVSLAALLGVLGLGTIAFRLVGLGWVDSFYQTVITISTVGYTEVATQSGEVGTTEYRLVSSAVILIGVGLSLYTIALVFEALMEGRLTDHLGRARMQRDLAHVSNHVIVCGWGQVGRAITKALDERGKTVVVVDRRPDLRRITDHLNVLGEATDDNVLVHAGVTRASGLIVALDGDADNLYVTLSGRSLNPDLFIVSRANSAEAKPKLRQAGADEVVNPHQIGGERMAAFMDRAHDDR